MLFIEVTRTYGVGATRRTLVNVNQVVRVTETESSQETLIACSDEQIRVTESYSEVVGKIRAAIQGVFPTVVDLP